MNPFSAFAGTGARIFVPSALTSRSDFRNVTGRQLEAAAVRSAFVQTLTPSTAVPSTISSVAACAAASSVR